MQKSVGRFGGRGDGTGLGTLPALEPPQRFPPDKLLVIDVRRPDELTSIGGFPAYLSIQLADLDKYLAYIPKERTIVTVSNHAGRAGRAADLLASKGFKVAGAIGVQDYEEQGGKLTKIAPKAPAVAAAK